MCNLRGMKRDAWEGRHRALSVVRWPKVILADIVCDQLITLGDFMATCAQITRAELNINEAEDSVSILPLLQGYTGSPVRGFAVHHSYGKFAIRKGDWVLIDSSSGGIMTNLTGFERKEDTNPTVFLLNLSERYPIIG